MTASKICTLIGSDKGGVGKSLLSQLLIVAYDQASRPLKVVEIDNQRTLSSVFGDRVDMSIDAAPGSSASGRVSVADHFARPYGLWSRMDSVTDLGANVTTPILAWMREQDVASLAQEDNIQFRFLTVAIPDEQSIRSAMASIEQARDAMGKDADIYLVLNDTVGLSGFAPYEATPSWKKLQDLIRSHNVEIISIPHCTSRLMDWGRAHGLTILQILANGDKVDNICQLAGFNRLQRKMEIRAFIDWVRQVQVAMTPLFTSQARETVVAAE